MIKETVRRSRVALTLGLVLTVVGAMAWGLMMTQGLLVTSGLGNIFNWGLLIAVFAFLVGFGAGGQLVASYIVLSGRTAWTPFALMAQAVGLAGAIGAAVAVMADLGNPWHILSMVLHPNVASPLVWDMVALTAFIAVAFVGLLALARSWRSTRVWLGIGIATAVGLQTVEGLLFALEAARPWWHSVIEPVDFLVVACVCGLALVTLLCALSKRNGALEAARHFARMLFAAVLVHIALSVAEVALLATETTAGAAMALELLGRYGLLYAAELGLPLVAAVAVRVRVSEAGAGRLAGGSALVVAGMFAHRLMLLYPALGSSTLFLQLSNQTSPAWAYPVSTGFLASAQQTFALSQAYTPALVEWLAALLPLGLTVLIAGAAYAAAVVVREKAVQ